MDKKVEGKVNILAIKIGEAQLQPLKTFRVIIAFMVSTFDYVVSVLPMEREWVTELQLIIDKVFCGVHRLSIRTAERFLYLPGNLEGV